MDETVSFEEQLYRDMVDRAFKGNDPRSFSNGKPEHAAYLIGRFFDHATSTIRLYCGNLARAINGIQVYASSDVIGSALEFLRRPNTRLLIVLENEIDAQSRDEHPLLRAISRAEPHVGGTTHVYTNGVQMGGNGNPVTIPHFMVMDQQGYRIEVDSRKVIASAKVNDVSQSQSLARFFDQVLVERNKPAVWEHPTERAA